MKKSTFAVFVVSLFVMTIFTGVIGVAVSSTTSIKETTDSSKYMVIGWVKDLENLHHSLYEVTAVNLWVFEKPLIPNKIEQDSRFQFEIFSVFPALLKSLLSPGDDTILFVTGQNW
ncbi:MAG: hypothetical protein JSW62_03440 [Thermoplasmatales archaeon]|nr:MAG: hypothetical protein JSW62_03440 [Thermoplasmatales archaeon]